MQNGDTRPTNIVQPKTTWNYLLDSERISTVNLRLNNMGRKIISRMHSDNPHFLTTQAGFTIFRNLGAVRVDEYGGKKKTVFNEDRCQTLAQEMFYKLVDLRKYPNAIAKAYSTPSKISVRSKYTAKKYFTKLNTYGHNRTKKLDYAFKRNLIAIMDQHMAPWMSNPDFEFDFKSFLETGKWLSHIKTSANSGYPDNIHQTKDIMSKAAGRSVKILNDYMSGKHVNWYKLPFEMGYRTERDDNHRVICMAPGPEKPISSTLAVYLDMYANTLPFNLPRKFGSYINIANEIFKTPGYIITKDFEAYDTSIPIEIFIVIRDWLSQFNNTIAWILRFELDLIINSCMIIAPNQVFFLKSLPSGIGTTQFFGSWIHWMVDLAAGIQYLLALYQSDDNIGVVKMSLREVTACFKFIEEQAGFGISPIGVKSSYDPQVGRFLQKWIDREGTLTYNHEQRAFTNGLFRERELSDDTVFQLLFGADDDVNKKKKATLSYLGNLSSYGQMAPSFPEICSLMYGRKNTGLTLTQIEWGLTNLESYMSVFLHEEQHRPLEAVGWLSGTFNQLLTKHGWTSVTAENVRSVLSGL